jgi:hypothetical protein
MCVIGECPGERAVTIRTDWAKRMWALVQKEAKNSKAPLDMDVANELKRMWKVEQGGALKTWQPVLTETYMMMIIVLIVI